MKMTLLLEGLFGIVDGTEEKTEANKDKDIRAYAKISLCVETSCYVHVQNAKSAKEAWDSLQSVFEGSSMNTIFNLTRRLFNSKQSNFKSMDDYVRDLLETYQISFKWVRKLMINFFHSLC